MEEKTEVDHDLIMQVDRRKRRIGPAEHSLNKREKKLVVRFAPKKPVWEVGSTIKGVSVLNLEKERDRARNYDKANTAKDSKEQRETTLQRLIRGIRRGTALLNLW